MLRSGRSGGGPAFGLSLGAKYAQPKKPDVPVDRDISSHSRRKQDDEILAELERDTQAGGATQYNEDGSVNTSGGGGGGAHDQDGLVDAYSLQASGKKKKAADSSSPEKSDRKEKAYTTSLPREDAHRFRATVSILIFRLSSSGDFLSSKKEGNGKE